MSDAHLLSSSKSQRARQMSHCRCYTPCMPLIAPVSGAPMRRSDKSTRRRKIQPRRWPVRMAPTRSSSPRWEFHRPSNELTHVYDFCGSAGRRGGLSKGMEGQESFSVCQFTWRLCLDVLFFSPLVVILHPWARGLVAIRS